MGEGREPCRCVDGVQQMRSGRSERLRDAVQRRRNIPLMGGESASDQTGVARGDVL